MSASRFMTEKKCHQETGTYSGISLESVPTISNKPCLKVSLESDGKG